MRGIDAQIAAMRRDWPDFRLTGRTGGRLKWKGPLRPLAVEYSLQIALAIPRERGYKKRTGGVPRVLVRAPTLTRRPSAPTDAIPHIYSNDEEPVFPYLCLYDPEQRPWSHDWLVAETIVPWAIEWLACYEIWHATGEWLGGGRHPTRTQRPEDDQR